MPLNPSVLRRATMKELLDERARCLILLGAIEAVLWERQRLNKQKK